MSPRLMLGPTKIETEEAIATYHINKR